MPITEHLLKIYNIDMDIAQRRLCNCSNEFKRILEMEVLVMYNLICTAHAFFY